MSLAVMAMMTPAFLPSATPSVALLVAILITVVVSVDGPSCWPECLQLIAPNIIIGIALFCVP